MEKKIIQIDALPQLKRKLRVAAYARVSSAKDAMLHSLSAQVSYYNKCISSHDDWEFVGIYADEGISGTKEDRDEFQRMINDCRLGKIDLILTKAISRFARNTMTMLETVRELKSLNVDVFFEEQKLHSISNDGEMVLTLLASVAQEEARSVSENQKWQIRKDFEKGLIWGGNNTYGYKIVNKKMVLVPEQAEIVQRIFRLYIVGLGFQKISKLLNDEGIPAMYAKRWNKQSLQQIIANINYTGDLLLQKTYQENYLTKKTKINKGQLEQFFVENDHEAIITREEYYAALEIRRKRAEYFKLYKFKVHAYPLTGFVR
ncbi:resolvase domain [Coprobacillus sp. CAG:698]|nr:resolvase domain [Coprobacillus sp. CAG:698]